MIAMNIRIPVLESAEEDGSNGPGPSQIGLKPEGLNGVQDVCCVV